MAINRVSFSSTQILVRTNLFRAQDRYRKTQEPATTGLRINTLSDSPGSISRLFALRDAVASNQQYERNTTTAQLRLDYTDSRLAQVQDVLLRVRDVVLRANDPTIPLSLRTQIGNQLSDMKNELLSQANSKLDDKYIFGGTATNTIPFSGTPTVFNGNSNSFNIQMNATLSIEVNVDGDATFTGALTTAVGTDLLTKLKDSDKVSLKVASGDTITIAGDIGVNPVSATLAVTSTTTLADLASSLQTALRAAGDGTEIAAVQPDGSVQVTSGAGAITNLTLSISGKTAFNTAFTFPTTIAGGGSTGNSDTLIAGTAEDIFDVIDDLSTAVSNADSSAITTHLERLENSIHQVQDTQAQVSTRSQQVISILDALQSDRVRSLDELSRIQDVDVTTAFSNLVTQETVLRLIFASSEKFLNAINGIHISS